MTGNESAVSYSATPRFDPGVPHPARIYNVWLGGKDGLAADRKAAAEVAACRPQVVAGARANRAFLARVVRYLAGPCGIRQFLDIGPGLPAPGNTHQVAQAIGPEARVVYVDNDPLVVAHARALLTSRAGGCCDHVEADLRDPETVLKEAARTLDFTQPAAVLLVAILHFLSDADDPADLVAALTSAGSGKLRRALASDGRLRARGGGRGGGGLQQAGPGRRCTQLVSAYDQLSFPLPVRMIHGDAWRGNLLRDGNRVVLADWDAVSTGPCETDVIPTLQAPRFGLPARQRDAFITAYGHDIRSWPGYPSCAKSGNYRPSVRCYATATSTQPSAVSSRSGSDPSAPATTSSGHPSEGGCCGSQSRAEADVQRRLLL